MRIDRRLSSVSASCLVAIAVVVLVTTTLVADVSAPLPQGLRTPRPQARADDLRPGVLLVASRDLRDPNFIETVILLVLHGDEGAMGLVLNRETDVPIGWLFESVDGAGDVPARVFSGGPVAPTGVQALVRSTSAIADGRRVTDEIHVVGSAEALTQRLGRGIDPDRFRIYFGYSGWSPGQLEREIAQGGWHIVEADAGVVFDRQPATLWRRQIRRAEVLTVMAPRAPTQSYSARSASTGYRSVYGASEKRTR